MIRQKTFDATGLAPNGILYAGDLNAIQDAAAAQNDLTQTIGVSTIQIGETGLQLFRYGPGEARLTGAIRTDGIIRSTGAGLLAGSFTTTARDAITAGSRPPGMQIYNTTTGRLEWNSGTDAAPSWRSVAADNTGGLSILGVINAAGGYVTAQTSVAAYAFNPTSAIGTLLWSNVQGEAQPRFSISVNGNMSWGPGGATVTDTSLSRYGINVLKTPGAIITGNGTLGAPGTPSGFFYNPSTVTGFALYSTIAADANARFAIQSDGTMLWGAGGATSPDVILSRLAANTLALGNTVGTPGYWYLYGSAATDVMLRIRLGAEANSRFAVWGNGIISWGAGGATAQDVQLIRGGTGLLQVQTFGGGAAGGIGVLQADLRTYAASATTAARTGGTATALPAAPVRYLAMLDENNNRVYVPAYS